MLIIDYKFASYALHDQVHIEYDKDKDDLRFEYLYKDKELQWYEFDYSRVRRIISKENIEQFFMAKIYKYTEGDKDMMISDRPAFELVVAYNGKVKEMHEDEYSKKPIGLIVQLESYVDILRNVGMEQLIKAWELENMGITLEGDNPSLEDIEKYRAGLMWESLSYNENKPTAEERKMAAGKLKVSLEACEKWKLYWWSKLKQHHEIKWL